MRPIISIIVPVYNVEVYLRQCLDSILSQTFTAWELILVDDGSPDGSGAICDEYAASDHRIRVFHIPNGGVSNARNVGMEAAKGDWITFIDSDDWVDPDFIESLYAPITKNQNLDFIQGGCQNFKESEGYSINQQYEHYIGDNHSLLFLKFRGLAVSKLYKTSIIRQQRLKYNPEIKYAEDLAFTIAYIIHVENFCLNEAIGYYYRYRTESATKSKNLKNTSTTVTLLLTIINGYTEYIAKYKITQKDSVKRWELIPRTIFNSVRANGIGKINLQTAEIYVSILRQFSPSLFIPRRDKRIYLYLFSMITHIRKLLTSKKTKHGYWIHNRSF